MPVPAMLLVLVLGMLSSTAGSASAAGWLEPKDISASNEVVDGRPQVAVDAAGDAVAIWERHVGGGNRRGESERPTGGDWSEPEVLSLPGEEGERSQVTIDAAGNAIAVWITEESIGSFVVRSAVRPPGGKWSGPEDVSDSISAAGSPRLAIDAASETVAVWTAFDNPDVLVQGAVRSTDGEWSEPDDLSPAGQDVTSRWKRRMQPLTGRAPRSRCGSSKAPTTSSKRLCACGPRRLGGTGRPLGCRPGRGRTRCGDERHR